VDDRHRHEKCGKFYGASCSHCKVCSEKLSIPGLYARLKEAVG
jgi:hypothetical protein